MVNVVPPVGKPVVQNFSNLYLPHAMNTPNTVHTRLLRGITPSAMPVVLAFVLAFVLPFALTVALLSGFALASLQAQTTPAMQSVNVTIDFTTSAARTQQDRAAAKRNGMEISSRGLVLSVGKQQGSIEWQTLRVPLSNVAPFLSLSVQMFIERANAENIVLSVRTSNDVGTAGTFGEWQVLNEDPHNLTQGETSGETDGKPARGADALANRRLVSRLLILPKETRLVQFKLESRKTAVYRNPVVKRLVVNFFSPGETPKATQEQIERLQLNKQDPKNDEQPPAFSALKPNTRSADIQAIPPRPRFITRTEWGSPTGQTAGAAQGDLVSTEVTHLIVHHSFSPGNNITDWAAAVRSIWNFHVNSNGWSDIGYNWLIDPNGVMYQGRAWVGDNENTRGAHFCGNNANTMGVCMMGNYSEIPAPASAAATLVGLLAYKAAERNIDPLGSSLHSSSRKTIDNISGHRDGTCATECPGNLLYPVLPDIRRRAADAIQAARTSIGAAAARSAERLRLTLAPNPATTLTTLRFTLAERAAVTIALYDALGNEIAQIFNNTAEMGEHRHVIHTASYSSGTYYLRCTFDTASGTATTTTPVVIVR